MGPVSSGRNEGISTACGIRRADEGMPTLSRLLVSLQLSFVQKEVGSANLTGFLGNSCLRHEMKPPFAAEKGERSSIEYIGISVLRRGH
jgi:hypothetical protein